MSTTDHYIVQGAQVDIEDHDAVAAFFGRRGARVLSVRYDELTQCHIATIEDAAPQERDASLLVAIAFAERRTGSQCEIFEAVREMDGVLKRGWWLKVLAEDGGQWEQFHYLGKHKRKLNNAIKKVT
jgi:hypothetical protein